MRFPSSFLVWLLLCGLPFQMFGQRTTVSNAHLVKTYTFYKNADPSLNHLNYFDAMAIAMRLSPQSKMVLQEESAGENGYTHFKYQQFHEGLPVFGNRYILHEKDGKVMTATGQYSPQVNVSATPGINATTAVAFAKQTMKAREYSTKQAAPILCFVDPAFPKVSENLRLVYQVDLHSTTPFDKRRYFVDASSGKIIKQLPLILQEGVPSKAKTRYYGMQNITTDSIASQEFVLRDLTRGEGIFIFNGDGSDFTNTSSTWDLTNAEQDEVALDAHYCTQSYYDMLLADYNWRGQDGQGKAFNAYVHDGDYVNAFWDGEASRYGDGDCNYGPLTTLEVMGHEFTHGIIDYTSQLVYDGESGAINESLADMFGKMLERKTDPTNFSWLLGHSFRLSPDVEPLRVMNDPNVLEMPAYYKGQYWIDGNGVHTNSSIGNLWFSMLMDGKQGTNEAGVAFNVPALGVNKVGQIIFQTNKNYLTASSNYNAFYQYSVEVAETLYGVNSAEAQAVKEAWKAVGLPAGSTNSFDLAIEQESFSVEKLCDVGLYISVKFKVINRGTVAYTPSMFGSVTLSSFTSSNYTVNLTTPIAPGEAFEIQVNNWLLAASVAGFAQVSADLDLFDDNLDNNYGYKYYSVQEFPANDLRFYTFLTGEKCFATSQHIQMYVNNNSCETIAAGTVLNFMATDDQENQVWASPPYTLDEDLPGDASLYLDYEMPPVTSDLIFTLLYPADPNPENNEYYAEARQYLPIIGNYLNDFETDYGEDEYLALPYNFVESNMLYQNTHYFATTGEYTEPEDFQRCTDVASIFNSEYAPGITANLRACLDFSSSPAPALEFDMVQFRNQYAEAANYSQSSMLQAKWKGTENGNQIIFGQQEAVSKHHNIPLPAYFKGELDFIFYTELGQWLPQTSYLTEDDFVLLDNVRLSAPTSGIDELSANFPVLLSPNPAQETTTIQAKDGIKTILLQNLNGQTLRTLQVHANSQDLDLKGLTNGFYLLNIQLENGQQGVKKLVKMD